MATQNQSVLCKPVIEESSKKRLLEDLKKIKNDSKPSKLVEDLDEKRKINTILLSVLHY